MALDATKEQVLKDVSLVDLFEQHRDLWKADATDAYEFCTKYLDTVRPDDVIKPLLPVLEVTPKLRDYLAQKRLSQQYWYERFAELIVDRLWDELKKKKRG